MGEKGDEMQHSSGNSQSNKQTESIVFDAGPINTDGTKSRTEYISNNNI